MTTEVEHPQQHAAPPLQQQQQLQHQQQGEAERQLQERIEWAARMRAQFGPEGMCKPDGSIDQVRWLGLAS